MKKIILLLILMFPSVVFADRSEVLLSKCIDGDTAIFVDDGVELKVRFIGVDTPETHHPEKGEQEGGAEASTFTCDLLTNADVIELEYDPKIKDTDKYGRTLAWVYVNNELVQELLIKNGLATVAYVYGDYLYINKLCVIQEDAIKNKLGIWEDGKREVGYCQTKSNKTTSVATTKKTSKVSKEKDVERIGKYIAKGQYEKVIKLLMTKTTSVACLIILVILYIIVLVLKKKKKRRGGIRGKSNKD